jgi:hypothetical protein
MLGAGGSSNVQIIREGGWIEAIDVNNGQSTKV